MSHVIAQSIKYQKSAFKYVHKPLPWQQNTLNYKLFVKKIPIWMHTPPDFDLIITTNTVSLPASLLVMSMGKAFNGMTLSLCGKQVVGPSSLPVVVAQSDKRHVNRA